MPETSLSLLLGAAMRSTIILAVALIAARLFVRRSAAVRHAVFTAGVVGVIVVPIAMVALPAVRAPFIAEAVSTSLEWLERPARSLRRESVARPVENADASVVDEISLRSPEGGSSHWHYDTFHVAWRTPLFGQDFMALAAFALDAAGKPVSFRMRLNRDWVSAERANP